MKIYDESYCFLILIAMTLSAFGTMDAVPFEEPPSGADELPRCFVDGFRYPVNGSCIDELQPFICRQCNCIQLEGPQLCGDNTLTDEYNECRIHVDLPTNSKRCLVERPRHEDGKCPQYLSCPHCACSSAIYRAPCPTGTRADKFGRCRHHLN